MTSPVARPNYLTDWVREAGARGDLYAPDCPARGLLEHLTSRWGVLVLAVLLEDTRRFTDLARALSGVSDKMLSRTLKDLERDGLVARAARRDGGRLTVEYSLTERGVGAALLVMDLTDWISTNLAEVSDARRRYDDRTTRRPPADSPVRAMPRP